MVADSDEPRREVGARRAEAVVRVEDSPGSIQAAVCACVLVRLCVRSPARARWARIVPKTAWGSGESRSVTSGCIGSASGKRSFGRLGSTEAYAVVHTHSTAAVSLACCHMDIPAFHYMVGVAGGKKIR
jgi:hypothetical protein